MPTVTVSFPTESYDKIRQCAEHEKKTLSRTISDMALNYLATLDDNFQLQGSLKELELKAGLARLTSVLENERLQSLTNVKTYARRQNALFELVERYEPSFSRQKFLKEMK